MIADPLQATCHFLSIPAEIRWIVYSLLFDGLRIVCERDKPTFTQSPYHWLHLQMPAQFEILLTCHQLLREGKQYFYENAVFDLNEMASYELFFARLPPSIRSHVRTVEGLSISRGIQSQFSISMKPDVTDMDRWLSDFPSLNKMMMIVDGVFTLPNERIEGVQSLNELPFEDILDAVTSPVTATGRPKWSLQPMVDLFEKHSNIHFSMIVKLRTLSAEFRGAKSLEKLMVHLNMKNRTAQLADSSFNDGIFATKEPEIQLGTDGTALARPTERRVAFTRGGIFALGKRG